MDLRFPVGLALAALVVLPALAGERMTARDIDAAFRDITLDGVYLDGAFFNETYRDDGSIRYRDSNGADSGKWSVQDGKFCTFYEGQQGACFVVERDGPNCFTFYEPDGKTGAITPGQWTSRGWNRERAPTCTEPPEAAV